MDRALEVFVQLHALFVDAVAREAPGCATSDIVPFLHGGVVEGYRGLTEQEFFDAVAMIIPGQVVITIDFIGYPPPDRSVPFWVQSPRLRPASVLSCLPHPYYRPFAGKGRGKAFVEWSLRVR